MSPLTPSPRVPTRCAWLAVLCLATWPVPVRALETPGECEPPRLRLALLTLTDATDRAWEAWTGAAPGPLVTRLLADSLRHARGREVLVMSEARPLARRATDDAPALEAARTADAEVVVTGTLAEFVHEDRREGGKFWRWGAGALDSRARAKVRLSLRVLDAVDGSVIIETTASRERTGRGTANVARPESPDVAPAPETLLGEAIGEVLADLVRTLDRRLEARWNARVDSVEGLACALDVGTTRGHFAGQRLEVWRAGIETFDEDLVRLGEEVRVGVLVVTALDRPGRVRARVTQGEARPGDRVRACSAGTTPALSLSQRTLSR